MYTSAQRLSTPVPIEIATLCLQYTYEHAYYTVPKDPRVVAVCICVYVGGGRPLFYSRRKVRLLLRDRSFARTASFFIRLFFDFIIIVTGERKDLWKKQNRQRPINIRTARVSPPFPPRRSVIIFGRKRNVADGQSVNFFPGRIRNRYRQSDTISDNNENAAKRVRRG